MLFQEPYSSGSNRQAQPALATQSTFSTKTPGCRLLTNVKPLLSRKDLINPIPLIVTETRRRHKNPSISMLDNALFQFIYVKCQQNLALPHVPAVIAMRRAAISFATASPIPTEPKSTPGRVRPRVRPDLGADAGFGEDFEEGDVGEAAIQDVDGFDAVFEGGQAGLELGDHATGDDP